MARRGQRGPATRGRPVLVRQFQGLVYLSSGFHQPSGGSASPHSGRELEAQPGDFAGASKAKATRLIDHVGSTAAPGSRPAMADGFLSAPMCDAVRDRDVESLQLPKDWAKSVRNAVLNVIGIVRIAMLVGREGLIQQGDVKGARIHQLESELAMLREELRINGARMQRIDPHRRTQYMAVERMAILVRRAMRGWSKAEAARRFFVTDDTIRAWLRRADDDLLVQIRTPVNRFPDFVRYAVQQIKLFCPTLGKAKIADKLARAGIHIGETTVGCTGPATFTSPPAGRQVPHRSEEQRHSRMALSGASKAKATGFVDHVGSPQLRDATFYGVALE